MQQEITPAVLEAAYFDLKRGESVSGKCLCSTTLFHINLSAYHMFVDTKKKGLIAKPSRQGFPPQEGHQGKRALSAVVYHEFITTLDARDRMQRAVFPCAIMGLRRSDSVGLS